MHRVVKFAFAFAIGCGSTDSTIDLTYDPCAFDLPVEAAGATDALALWQLAPTAGAPRIEIRVEDAAPSFYGYYDDEAGVVYINARIVEPHARAVVLAHELGHAFGLPHVDERTSLMNPGNYSIEPTADDRAALSALWGACERPRS